MIYDVGIIGAGIIGASIARELSKYKLDVCLVEKENDVSCGTSKANSGIIHAGYDPEPGSLKAKLNVRGNEMYSRLAQELHFDFSRIGSLTLAYTEEESKTAAELLRRGKENGVPGLRLLDRSEILEMEPSINEDVLCALYAPSAGIISPYQAVWAIAENAVVNGVKFYRECEVHAIRKNDEGWFILDTGKGQIVCRRLVNAAGLYADKISEKAGGRSFMIKPRRGEYCLFDNNCSSLARHVLFQIPGKMGKGVLVTPTVDGNILVGPSADDNGGKENFSTTRTGQEFILEKAEKTIPGLPRRSIINSFSGLRAIAYCKAEDGSENFEHFDDFIIERDSSAPGLIQAAGICSPGLTAAPAIAEYVCALLKESGLSMTENCDFISVHKGIKSFKHADTRAKEKLVEENNLYGRIICRCEMITEAEIVQAIQCPLGARDLDGVKRRTRAGMGRCQGGFCSPRITEIISRELQIPMINVTKSGGSSFILDSKTRDIL